MPHGQHPHPGPRSWEVVGFGASVLLGAFALSHLEPGVDVIREAALSELWRREWEERSRF